MPTSINSDTHKINQLKSNPTITYHNIKPKISMDVSSKRSYSRIKSTGDIGGKGISLKTLGKDCSDESFMEKISLFLDFVKIKLENF